MKTKDLIEIDKLQRLEQHETIPMGWANETVHRHLSAFPISTVHSILDKFEIEIELNGGLSTGREQRLMELYVRFTHLVNKIRERS